MQTDLTAIEVLFRPAEFAALRLRNLVNTTCVVFDVFRATSTIVTALAQGATEIIPVAEIAEALAIRDQPRDVLLAGERNGLRIGANLTGGVEFDLGNSPREFVPGIVGGKRIVLSTTNGSRALRACAHARTVLASSFLNLKATAAFMEAHASEQVILVCSGTGEEEAYEDVLGAGALASLIWPASNRLVADSANIARQIYERHQDDLQGAVILSRNGRRLLGIPELREDVAWCLQRDVYPLVARMVDGKVTEVK